MTRIRSSFIAFAAVLAMTSAAAAAVQGAKFPGGTFRTHDGENNVALTFDSSGALTAYVNGEAFSSGSWESKADTLMVGPLQAPEGYGCPAGAKYLWSIEVNTLKVKVVSDDCQLRLQYFTALTWTKG
jgi:hypothetical protein